MKVCSIYTEKEQDHVLALLVGSHKANHPSIKKFRLKSALREYNSGGYCR